MIKIISEIGVARLDGFLTGVMALNGRINDYYAGAFFIENTTEQNLDINLIRYFQSRCTLNLSDVKYHIKYSQIEQEIQIFIAENILNYPTSHFDCKAIDDRKKYISFKILDMIEFLMPNHEQSSYVFEKCIKIDGLIKSSTSKDTFFCFPCAHHFLVLQFTVPCAGTRIANSS